MLITTEQKHKQVHLHYSNEEGKLKALLYVLKLNGNVGTTVVDVRNFGLMTSAVEAYLMDDTIIATLPPELRAKVEKDRKWVTSVVASRQKVADAYIVRNSLLAMPVEAAIAFQLKNGQGNAIEYIFPIIQKDFERYTNDGYMHDVFANFEETVDF